MPNVSVRKCGINLIDRFFLREKTRHYLHDSLMNRIWKISYGTVVTAVFKMTTKSICPHFRASYDTSADEFPDVGKQPAPLPAVSSSDNQELSFLSLEKVSSFHPSSHTDVGPLVRSLPLLTTGAAPLYTLWGPGQCLTLSPVQEQNLSAAWDVLGAPSLYKPAMTSGLWKCHCFCKLQNHRLKTVMPFPGLTKVVVWWGFYVF